METATAGSGSSGAMRRPSADVEVCRRTLSYHQVERLTDVVDSQLEVPGRGNYPTLKMSVRKLVEAVRRRLDADDMAVNDIRINGGAASYIVIGDDDQVRYLLIELHISRFKNWGGLLVLNFPEAEVFCHCRKSIW